MNPEIIINDTKSHLAKLLSRFISMKSINHCCPPRCIIYPNRYILNSHRSLWTPSIETVLLGRGSGYRFCRNKYARLFAFLDQSNCIEPAPCPQFSPNRLGRNVHKAENASTSTLYVSPALFLARSHVQMSKLSITICLQRCIIFCNCVICVWGSIRDQWTGLRLVLNVHYEVG